MSNKTLGHLSALVVMSLTLALGTAVVCAQEGGGLAVGDIVFQDDFEDWQDANQRVEADWETWSLHDCQIENAEGDFDALCGAPEYKQASPGGAYPYRVHGGQNAQQYHTVHQGHHGGVWRRFSAPPGAIIEVHAWGEAWSTGENDPHAYDSAQHVRMRIGVDPNGGSNPAGASVVWGTPGNPPNQWLEMPPVSATVGETGEVSVFLSSNPKYPLPHNDIYWDDVYALYKGAEPDLPGAEDPAEPVASAGNDGGGNNGGNGNSGNSGNSGSNESASETSAEAPDPILNGMVEVEAPVHPGRGGDAGWLWVPIFAMVTGTYLFFVPRLEKYKAQPNRSRVNVPRKRRIS